MIRALMTVLVLIVAAPAAAVDPGDFSHVIPLSVDKSGVLAEVQLPAVVYPVLTRSDLGDMRVFNGEHRVVPHVLRAAGPAIPAHEGWADAPVYPLPAETAETAAGIHIDTSGGRTRVDIHPEGTKTIGHRQWIVDARAVTGPIDLLKISWTTDGADTGILPVTIARSSDLSHWQPLSATGIIAGLSHQGMDLFHRRLTVPADRYAYLRISIPAPEDFVIDAVRVRLAATVQPVQRYRETAAGRTVSGKTQRFLFSFDGVHPAERAVVSLPVDGQIVAGILSSRSGPQTDWQRRYSGLFYRLRSGESIIDNGSITLGGITDRYWQLVLAPDDTVSGGAPTLTLEWVPHKLVFSAEGPPPFLLAYGSDRVGQPNTTMAALMKRLKPESLEGLIVPAAAGEPAVMAGQNAYRRFSLPANWRRWGLWAVLCAGALMLIWLAWRQFRKMNP